MKIARQIVVFDAADLATESTFWAGVLGGRCRRRQLAQRRRADGQWRIGVQLPPNHTPPDWPHGVPQQVHLDLHVDDPADAHDEVMALGARLLQAADDLTVPEGHQVYADPAGHPFCIGWGH